MKSILSVALLLCLSHLVLSCKESPDTQNSPENSRARGVKGSKDGRVGEKNPGDETKLPTGAGDGDNEENPQKEENGQGGPIKDGGGKEEEKPIVDEPSKGKDEGMNNALPSFCSKLEKSGDWASSKAFYGPGGKLSYPLDEKKNRIPDFSFAGYRYGEREPPHYPVVQELKPIAGDNTAHIQKALDELSKKEADKQGVRGALLLAPGRYEIRGSLSLKGSGLVLRGSGDGDDPTKDTILFARGNTPHQRTVLTLGSQSKDPFASASQGEVEITDEWVTVGATSVNVAEASRFKVGDWVQIKHPSTHEWLREIQGGGVKSDPAWTVGSTDILYFRKIKNIQGNALTFDAPIYNHLNRKLAVSTVELLKKPDLVSESGIENLRIDIETKGGEDEDHAWNAIAVSGAEDSWVRGITTLHFGQAGVVTKGSIRITVDQARTLEPVGIRTGERFYNFNAAAMSQLILIKNCYAKDGRHNFISNGVQTASGLVFHRCTIEGDSDSEGHRRWSTGMLFDSIEEKGEGGILLYNRQDYGTSHGWAAAHSVIWNYNGFMTVQQPPTAENYAISSRGRKKSSPHAGKEGHVEIKAGRLFPASLYEAQLCERLGSP